MNFIAYAPNGEGCYLQVGSYTDLQAAIAACPTDGKVEQIVENGSITIFP